MNGSSDTPSSELWVCFTPPPEHPNEHVVVLSFVAPSAEAAMHARFGSQIINGRTVVQQVRSEARAEYVRLIARLGSTPCVGGRTLRQALRGPENVSRWWFLDVTEKDCLWDEDTIYTTLLQRKAVEAVRSRHHITRMHLFGAVPAFAAALGQPEHATPGVRRTLARAIASGIMRRVALIVEYLGLWWTLRRLPAPAAERFDVLMQGYWDWTVRLDASDNLRDRYFTDLPAQLARRGLRPGWLASYEPSAKRERRGRGRRSVLAASRTRPEITLLERYLTPADIVRTASNFRYPIQVTRFVMSQRFRALCRTEVGDLHLLIARQLLRSAWGGTFCRLELVATATARACRQLRPRMVLTSWEFLLRSRALYVGVRACSPRTRVWAAQHAGYSSDKTLGVFDPEIEIRGAPDGHAVPAPDGVFAIGDLSRRIWEANGLATDRVVVTGGLRYQAVRIEAPAVHTGARKVSLLLAGGMCEAPHLDLCDALVTAVLGLPPVDIRWRDHPVYPLIERPAFRRFRKIITVASGTLEDDLGTADLVLFSQTGLAEEALLRGIATWQWLWPGFNTSPFLDVPVIPTFASVGALRRELRSFVRDPARYRPSSESQRRVLDECFGPNPAGASARIADEIHRMMSSEAGAHA